MAKNKSPQYQTCLQFNGEQIVEESLKSKYLPLCFTNPPLIPLPRGQYNIRGTGATQEEANEATENLRSNLLREMENTTDQMKCCAECKVREACFDFIRLMLSVQEDQ